MSGRRFRYPLEPLRARREWERDARRQEVARLDARLAAERERLAAAERRFADAHAEWRRRVEGEALDPGLQKVASDFLAHTGAGIASQKAQVSKSADARRDAALRAVRAQRALDGLERHRNELAAARRRAEQAREVAELDALWLQGAAHRGSEP
jgi:hypothetical protein